MSVFSMPTAAVGRDRDGLPTRITVPERVDRPLPLLAGETVLGRIEPDGHIWWYGNIYDPSLKPTRIQVRARKLRAVIHDGEVVAVVAVGR